MLGKRLAFCCSAPAFLSAVVRQESFVSKITLSNGGTQRVHICEFTLFNGGSVHVHDMRIYRYIDDDGDNPEDHDLLLLHGLSGLACWTNFATTK